MISGVSSYSSYSYSSALRSSSTSSAPSPEKLQEKLFSILDSDGDGSIAKDELDSALSAAKEADSSLSIDIDELFSQLDANGDGSIDLDETAALAPPPPPPRPDALGSEEQLSSLLDSLGQNSASAGEEENYSDLIAKLLQQYQSSGSYQSSLGSQLDLSA